MWDAESIKNANATMHHYFFFLGDFNPSETWPFLKPKCIYLGPFYITRAHDSLAPAMGPAGPATLAFITTVLSATWQHHAHAVVEHQNGCKERHAQHPIIVPERPRWTAGRAFLMHAGMCALRSVRRALMSDSECSFQ